MAREPLFEGPARRRAVRALSETVEMLCRLGYAGTPHPSSLEAYVRGEGRVPLRVRLVQTGRVFGGTYALEISTASPILPVTRGLSARGRGVVRMTGIAFRPRRGDAAGRRLASLLAGDPGLDGALRRVHFERISVEPDGRAVIRHMGGSVVWVLFPPIVKQIPLLAEQVQATVRALEAFAAAGGRA